MKARENTLLIATLCTAVLAVLAFFGIREYTDISGDAKIAELKIGKGHDVNSLNSEEAVLFPNEDFHAEARLTNIADAYQLKARVLFDRVNGQQSGALVPGTEKTYEVREAGRTFFYYSTTGWPIGVYKVDINLIDRRNQQKDREAAYLRITVTD